MASCVALLLVAFIPVTARPAAGTIFLTGDYIQLPIDTASQPGRFMADFDLSGARYNPAGTGGAAGTDFWVSGTPVYNYTIAVGGTTFRTNGSGWSVAPIVTDTSSGAVNSATISGQPVSGLMFTRQVSFGDGDQFIIITDALTNTSGSALNQVATLDNTDPDPDGFLTSNDVVSVQVPNDFAAATGSSGLTLGFGAGSPLRVVDCSGFENTDPYLIIASPNDPHGITADIGLNIALDYGTIADSASKTATWFMVFSPTKAAAIATYAQVTGCGDAMLGVGEECDDGGTAPGDGCSAACRVEPCYSCSGTPSTCTSLPDGSVCDDGLFCNGADTCSSSVCAVHVGDPCTGGSECNDGCNENTNSCLTEAGAACSDDGDVCTDDVCDGAGTCTHPGNFFVLCDDGVFCNGPDACFAGSCSLHDGDPCAFDDCNANCNETSGMCDPTAAGTPCPGDGNECTGDECDGAGLCAHPMLPMGTPCATDGNQCTGDACNGAGACLHPTFADGTACDDADACTQTDECQGGNCVGGNPVVCTAPLCHTPPECDVSTGLCTTCPDGYEIVIDGCRKTYGIGAPLLDNLPFVICDSSHRYNGCDGPFGFHWTDTADDAVGPVTRVDVLLNTGFDCTSSPHGVTLNDEPIGVYATTAATCACPTLVPRLLADVDASAYVKGASNSVSIDSFDCTGLSADALGRFAAVTVTYEDLGPALEPRTGCRQAAKSRFRYRDDASDARDRMQWKWGNGDETTQDDFGDPTSSADYQMCVFAETSGAPTLLLGAEVPADSSRWSAAGSSGYKYRDAAAAADGMKGILLRGGAAGRSKLLVKGQGMQLGDPALPLGVDLSGLRVQLTNTSSGLCWESEFPLSTITADDQRIKATVRP